MLFGIKQPLLDELLIKENDITYPNVIDRDVNNGGSETWDMYGVEKSRTWVVGRDGKFMVDADSEKLMEELEKERSGLEWR